MKPDVVPGDYDAAAAAYYAAASAAISGTSQQHQSRISSVSAASGRMTEASVSNSPSMSRKKMPLNKQHAALRQQSVSER